MKTDWQNTLTGKHIKSCRLPIRTLICVIFSAISLSAACQGYRYQEKALKFNMGIKCGALYSDMSYSALTTATSIGNIAPAAGATTELHIFDIASIGIDALYTQLGTNKHFFCEISHKLQHYRHFTHRIPSQIECHQFPNTSFILFD